MANETDSLRQTATGAPLRAIATLAAIWILGRIVAWNLPGNTVVIPVIPKPEDTAIHATEQAASAQSRDSAKLNFLTPINFSAGASETQVIGEAYEAERMSQSLTGPAWSYTLSQYSLPASQLRLAGAQFLPTELPAQSGSLVQRSIEFSTPPENSSKKPHRNGLQGYLWFFARQGTNGTHLGAIREGPTISNGQYGGSQAGAILSYPIRTRPESELSVYGRMTAALTPLAQEEVAFGASMHLVRDLPVALHVEQRLDVNSGGNRGTAFYVAGGTGPDQIVADIALETYVQGGYILGKNETYFFDASATLQRSIVESSANTISIGPGMWIGGQRKLTRMDVGPRADIRVPIAATTARIAVDWRARIAGDARPGSGLTITMSTSF
ncbi:hypothetical protein [Parasphingorhabdus sp.]|uniref:hypothetical protein n=1 Tax=Parasphingorhabdus sp. TaxID=2709688 RepID=UPI003A932466